ncbi:hypothetical protein [Rhizobium sp. TRM95796]|uniref:hypothetical protein n=1 Tax=Rhizobium sp. TRM95796 TaxID=2979862 RepID=UPI0021E7D0E0|nr:hypothetical protein [Rhizobium sp. TRM95796]MCV3768731.1 hypothetical protein [Rhizobium sp. TRM95796]
MTQTLEKTLASAAALDLRGLTLDALAAELHVKRATGTRALKQKRTAKKKTGSQKRATAAAVAKTRPVAAAPRIKEPAFEPGADLIAGRDAVIRLVRKNADNVFSIGAALIPLQEAVPEKSWSKFLKPTGLTARTAWNYMSVARSLTEYRKELVEADIAQTVLYVLARGPSEIVEMVLDAARDGKPLKGSAVRRMVAEAIGETSKPRAPALNRGGLSGLRGVAAERINADGVKLIEHCKAILGVLVRTLALHVRGHKLSRQELAPKITDDAHSAYMLIWSVTRLEDVTRKTGLEDAMSWRKAYQVLEQLSSQARWPAKADVAPWLQHTVLPVLEFVVYGKSLDINQARPGVANAIEAEDRAEEEVQTSAGGRLEPAEVPALAEDDHQHAFEVDVAFAVEEEREVSVDLAPVDEDPETRAAAIYAALDLGEPVQDSLPKMEWGKRPFFVKKPLPSVQEPTRGPVSVAPQT